MLVALLALLLLTYGDSGPSGPAQDALVRLDAKSGEVLERVRTGKQLTAVAAAKGSIWSTDAAGGALIRLRPPAYEPQTLAAQGVPYALAAGPRFVLTANGDNGTVSVFEASSGRLHTIAHVTGSGIQAVCDVALNGATGWATDCLNRRIVKFDADSGRVLHATSLPPSVDDETTIDRLFAGIAVGPDAVWVAGDVLDPTLYRLNRDSGLVEAEIRVPAGTVAVAVGAGSVWLANQLDDSVIRIDATTNAVTARIRVGREPLSIAFGAGRVWTANALDGTVSRIDPASERKPETLRVGPGPVAVSAGPGGRLGGDKRAMKRLALLTAVLAAVALASGCGESSPPPITIGVVRSASAASARSTSRRSRLPSCRCWPGARSSRARRRARASATPRSPDTRCGSRSAARTALPRSRCARPGASSRRSARRS